MRQLIMNFIALYSFTLKFVFGRETRIDQECGAPDITSFDKVLNSPENLFLSLSLEHRTAFVFIENSATTAIDRFVLRVAHGQQLQHFKALFLTNLGQLQCRSTCNISLHMKLYIPRTCTPFFEHVSDTQLVDTKVNEFS